MLRVISRKREVAHPDGKHEVSAANPKPILNSPAAERSNKLESNLVLNVKVLVH